MIKRIVKMEFAPEKTAEFQALFEENKAKIAAFPGCHGVELLQDVTHTHIFFTFSHWESENALNEYRMSPLFESVWKQTKALFNAKPMAWSTTAAG